MLRAIESRQSYEARRRGILIPQRGGFQPVFTLKELFLRDHGGLIFAPEVGLHENVGALDFESMFPSLITNRNISYENIHRDNEKEGFLVEFTREALERRLHFKHLRRFLHKGSQEYFWCQGRQLALKEILFCTYGYSGCWANRFGNFDTFMEINRAARNILVKSMNIARKLGYRVLYGNNDSLFLQKQEATRDDYEVLSKKITNNVGLPMAVEAIFKFLVLLPQKDTPDMGAVNRYYGKLDDGSFKHRGIELRRRDTPPFVAKVQKKAIEILLSYNDSEQVIKKGVHMTRKFIEDSCELLRRCEIPRCDLKISKVLRRELGEYKAKPPHVATAEAIGISGAKMGIGNYIDYIYTNASHGNRFRRVRPATYNGGYDSEKYIQLVKEAERSILIPFHLLTKQKKQRNLCITDWI
jgi:DNA polymerase elongation subunit (family B)